MSGYIGTQPVPQATQTRDAFTCTAGQTSFATSGYTPSFLDVYLNGIKLAAADYTASNGSDVVLASGAALDDILEVVAYTAFEAAHVTGADDFTVTGSFTSQGIDDNATSTAMTLDASGNLLVGTTSTNIVASSTATDEGFVYVNGAALTSARSAGQVADFNRITNDGEIIRLRKDGAAVGSIGAGAGGFLTIGSPNGTPVYATFANGSLKPTTSLGSNSDGGGDLGNVSARWKDLYLSGGAYLGGTTSSNKLDDYEEGTWTPTIGLGTTTSVRSGKYVKVGNIVHFSMRAVYLTERSSSATISFTLPFTASTTTLGLNSLVSSVIRYISLDTGFYGTHGVISQSGTTVSIYQDGDYKSNPGLRYDQLDSAYNSIALHGSYYTA